MIVILVFAVFFSFIYASSLIYLRIEHHPDVIPTSPTFSEEQALAVVESDYRKNVPSFREAYLHFQYYNYSRENKENEDYQNYLQSLAPGWRLSEVKQDPSLLTLPLVFVHANGTIYTIDSEDGKYEKICRQPSRDCPLGNYAQKARDRLVFEVGAIVEGTDGYNFDVHNIIDAETGKIVIHTPYSEPLQLPDGRILDNTKPVKALEEELRNARSAATVEIRGNSSGTAYHDMQTSGYEPQEVVINLENDSDAIIVTWINRDSTSHTVTSDNGYSDLIRNELESGTIPPDGKFAFAFTEAGDYQYHCRLHPWIRGQISVLEYYY